jgi:hypothetical protein
MNEPIDRKYTFCATSCEHSREHSHMDAMVFLARDQALPRTLVYYREECMNLGAQPEQLKAIDLLIERVLHYQHEHASQVKVADVDVPDLAGILDDNETVT